MMPLLSLPTSRLHGDITVPGDKSISHRALILGACAVGETTIEGLLAADDVLHTAAAMRRLGATVERSSDRWRVVGRGVGGLDEPADILDFGNSGTAARLVIGLLATHPFFSVFTGDESLRRRPMKRVIAPLTQMGAAIVARSGDRLPLAMHGAADPLPIEYRIPIASAQVKSAILLAGLNAPGRTSVIEPAATRDHTERLLRHFGAEVDVCVLADGGRQVAVTGQPELSGTAVSVPADISSAAFPLVAALTTAGSRVTVRGVGVNPLRTGLLDTLTEMGARMSIFDGRERSGEPIADITAELSSLRGVDVPAARVPAMIDEFPILAVAAACASGVTRMSGLAELKVKESDRLTAIATGLRACGVNVESGEDWLTIEGCGGPPPGGGRVAVQFDHRIAMAFLVLGMAGQATVTIDDARAIATSFPGFTDLMNGLGARISADGGVS